LKTQVLVIGGGATGTGIARDLALRGVQCILVEQNDLNCGASGGNHGLLHSGARYVSNDGESAKSCRSEGNILKQYAHHCIENTGGFFVAVEGDDEKYIANFPHFCNQWGLPCQSIDVKDAFDMEPSLSPKTIAVYQVEDASIDPFKLSLENMNHAQTLGSTYLRMHKVIGFHKEPNKIISADVLNMKTKEVVTIEADQFMNAAGAWAAQIASFAGETIGMRFSKGTLLITNDRIAHRVINRLRPPSNGDILVPGGTVSILGTTSVTLQNLDTILPTIKEVDINISEGATMVPSLETVRYVRAYAGVRPLVDSNKAGSDDRSVSREYELIDHKENGLENLATITGGKLTTFRLMAEKATDLICNRLGVKNPCTTHTTYLPDSQSCQWTEPGRSPWAWMIHPQKNDQMICECEMVPKSSIDHILNLFEKDVIKPGITAIGRRSRIGKGSCQGTFCSIRVANYLHDKGCLSADEGIYHIKDFVDERWKGQRTILWDNALIQAEIQEALHCGFLNLELETFK